MSEEGHLCLFQQDPAYPTALLGPCSHQQLLDMEIHHQNVLHSSWYPVITGLLVFFYMLGMWSFACISLHLKNIPDLNLTQHYSSQIQPNDCFQAFQFISISHGVWPFVDFMKVNKDDDNGDDPIFVLKWAVLPRFLGNTLPLFTLKWLSWEEDMITLYRVFHDFRAQLQEVIS